MYHIDRESSVAELATVLEPWAQNRPPGRAHLVDTVAILTMLRHPRDPVLSRTLSVALDALGFERSGTCWFRSPQKTPLRPSEIEPPAPSPLFGPPTDPPTLCLTHANQAARDDADARYAAAVATRWRGVMNTHELEAHLHARGLPARRASRAVTNAQAMGLIVRRHRGRNRWTLGPADQ